MTSDNLYISPKPIFERIKLDHYVHRSHIIGQIDAFIANQDRGYIILEADAGLGKTMLMANLVQTRGYIHLFVEQARGLDNLANAIHSLAVQLIQHWHMQSYFADDLLPGVAVRADFLQRMLSVASNQRDQRSPNEPIVLLIDGLESTDAFPGHNVLGLPQVLPKGVYVVVTQRPKKHLDLHIETPVEHIVLRADDDHNMQDMQHYLEQMVQRPLLAKVLSRQHVSHDQFVTMMLQKSHGIWSYPFCIIEELEQGKSYTFKPISLRHIPDGISAYYADYWYRQRESDWSIWHMSLLPLLCTLGAVMEPVSAETLSKLTNDNPYSHNILAVQEIQNLLENRWRSFVNVERGKEVRYSMGDNVLRDFLHGHVIWDEPSRDDLGIANEMATATHKAHNRIAQRYFTIWGELEHELLRLEEPNLRDIDQGYGLRHIVTHLNSAKRYNDIHTLLQLEQTASDQPLSSLAFVFEWIDQAVQGWQGHDHTSDRHILIWHNTREKEGDIADFLGDIAQAWLLTEEMVLQEQEDHAKGIGLQTLYALTTTSINSRSHNIPASLLKALFERGIWTAPQMMVYIREITDGMQKAVTLTYLVPVLPSSAMENMLAIARSIRDEEERAVALKGLAPHISRSLFSEIQSAAQGINNPVWRSRVLISLLPRLAKAEQETLIATLFETIQAAWNAHMRVDILIEIAPHLSSDNMNKALAYAQAIVDDDWRAQALIGLAPYLSQQQLRDTLKMWETWRGYWRAKVMAEIAPRLGEMGDIDDAIRIIRSVPSEQQKADSLTSIAPYLSEPLLNEAQKLALEIENPSARASAVIGIAPYLPRILLREALMQMRTWQNNNAQAITLVNLIQHFPTTEHPSLIRELIETVQAIEDDQQRLQTLMDVTPRLAELQYVQDALTLVQTIEGKQNLIQAKAHLAPYLPEIMLEKVLDEIPQIEDPSQRNSIIAKIAPHLPESMIPQALRLARAIGDGSYRVKILAALATYIPESLIAQILEIGKTMLCEQDSARMLVEIAPHLPTSLRKDAYAIASNLQREDYQMQALVALVPYLKDSQISNMLEQVKSLKNQRDKAFALENIVSHISATHMQEAFAIAQTIETEQIQTNLFVHMAPYLAKPLVQKALEKGRAYKHAEDRDQMFAALLPQLAQYGDWQHAFDVVWEIGKTSIRVKTLVAMVPYLPHMKVLDVLALIRTIEAKDMQAFAFAAILSYIAETEQSFVETEMLRSAIAARWKGEARPSHIVSLLPETFSKKKLLDAIPMIDSPAEQVKALVDLMPYLDQTDLQQQAQEIGMASLNHIWSTYYAEAVKLLAPYLSERYLLEILEQTRMLERTDSRIEASVALVPYLPNNHKATVIKEPLEDARSSNTIGGLQILVQLIPYLPQKQRSTIIAEAMAKVCRISESQERYRALEMMSPHLATLPFASLYPIWCNTLHTLATRTRYDLLSDLEALIPVLHAIGGKEALTELAEVIIKIGRWFT